MVRKFDTSCGLLKKEIDIIKYNVKDVISRKLPVLPDLVETKLFLQGRDAWVFRWVILNDEGALEADELVVLEVVAKLKKEFHRYLEPTHYEFVCEIQRQTDIYSPKISITNKV